jgi:hypothetical protein
MVLSLFEALVNARDGRAARRWARGAALGRWLVLGAVLGAGCGGTGGTGGSSRTGRTGGSSGAGGSSGTGGEAGDGAAGGGPSPSCGLTACGGELDGLWNAREVCVTELEPTSEPGCEHALAHSAEIEGTYTFFAATGRLLTDVTLTSIVTLEVDDACATALAGDVATADLACPELQARYDADPSFESAECAMQGELCRCVLVAPPTSQNVLNDYTTSGTRIVDGQGDTVEYCVEADELGLEFADSDFRLSLFLDRG